ncbi:MAG: DUF1287 domain-containing protein [Dokdonella sp.]
MRLPVLPGVLALLLLAGAARGDGETGRMLAAAHAQIGVTVRYAPAYVRLDYPGGDVAVDRGVCSDVLIRAMRAVGVDLQVDVHRDMRAHFSDYPRHWGLTRPDANIDHRRVPNLERYFERSGKSLPLSRDPADFEPGDFVSWRLDGGQPHIGIVSDQRSADGLRPLIVHNIGAGTQLEDVLFEWKMSGHFRYFAGPSGATP